MLLARSLSAAVALVALPSILGCSDPPPPAPEAAWTINFQPLSGESTRCALSAGHIASIGTITAEKRDKLLPDGSEGAAVSCTVSGNKEFKVSADAAQSGTHLVIEVDGLASSATVDMPATGSLSYASKQTSGLAYAASPGKPCQFYFIPDTGEGVSLGTVWVAFKCPEIVDGTTATPGGGPSTCQITQGFASFKNCSVVE